MSEKELFQVAAVTPQGNSTRTAASPSLVVDKCEIVPTQSLIAVRLRMALARARPRAVRSADSCSSFAPPLRAVSYVDAASAITAQKSRSLCGMGVSAGAGRTAPLDDVAELLDLPPEEVDSPLPNARTANTATAVTDSR